MTAFKLKQIKCDENVCKNFYLVMALYLTKLRLKRYSHADSISTDKLSLTCFKSILKISHVNYL